MAEAKNGSTKNGAAKTDTPKTGTAKPTVVAFSASWMPGEKEKADPNLGLSGMIQVVEGKPTDQPAHVVLREYNEKTLSYYPGVTIPTKKQISYGPDFKPDDLYGTDLHQVRIEKNGVITTTAYDGTVARYKIERVDDLTA